MAYRFLLSRRWLAYLGLAALFSLACLLLGRWQMARFEEANAKAERVGRNYDSAPVPFAQAAGQFARPAPESEWLPVALKGSYRPEEVRIVRNRPLNGQPGYELLVPLRLDTGQTVVVDRGWLPIGDREPGRPDSVPPPPSGQVAVTVRLRPGEPALGRGAPAGQLASIDLSAYAAQLPYPLLSGAYGQLAAESPPAPAAPTPLPRPEPQQGTNLSYALQWVAFAVLMLIGFGYAARQQARNDEADATADAAARARAGGHAGSHSPGPAEALGQAGRPGPRRRRKPSAEEEEDAILDALGYH